MPSVSLIIPCFNHAGTLERAVSSGVLQKNLEEIIVVDDCSTDDSLSQAYALSKKFSSVRVLQMPANGGPGAARNYGVKAAKGQYLCFLDADDELVEDFFADAISLMATHRGMHVVKVDQEFFDPVKGYILPVYDPRHDPAVLSSAAGVILSRAVFECVGGFSEDPAFRGPMGGEDVAFMQAMIEYFQPIGRLNRPCYRVWSNEGSHVDSFLSNTRLTDDGFEFVSLHPDQQPGAILSQAMQRYLSSAQRRISANKNCLMRQNFLKAE